jgi:UDP-N-acetylmuramate--alanine ligase
MLPYNKIYFVGVKGVGMASLAVIAKQAGYEVRGSDVGEEFITDSLLQKNNIHIDTGFTTENLVDFVGKDLKKSLVIVTAAHDGLGNPQAVYAKERNLDVLTYGQALGMFQYGTLLNRQDIIGISVAGSHGKTTTSAMLATVLSKIDEDPTYLIGTSDVGALGDAGKYGKGKFFVVESDEYMSDVRYDPVPKFHYQHPLAAIITNIDFDHPDVFKNIEDVYNAFDRFVQNIQDGGALAVFGDNSEYEKIYSARKDAIQIVTFGLKETNTYQASNIITTKEGISFNVIYQGESLGEITMPVIGTHNCINALSVIALLHTLQVSFENIANGLKHFTGTKRRLEIKGVNSNGQLVVDDYAHHPVEIRATLTALKSAYPDKKIICIFQPHTLSRTESLLQEFSNSFEGIEKLLLLPIFTSAREGKLEAGKQEELYTVILKKSGGIFLESPEDVVEYCTQNFLSDEYMFVTMGAGNVYKIVEKLGVPK